MKTLLTLIFAAITIISFSQDVTPLLKEAQNFERVLKEEQALEKYKQVIAVSPTNLPALLKTAEITAAIGSRQKEKKARKPYYDAAKVYASKAFALNPNNADVNYVMSIISGKMTEVETDNKKIIEYVKDIRIYADKALSINPKHARATYALGKWNFEIVQLSWVKKMAVKAFFGGMEDAKIEDAIMYMEKARVLDQYYVINYLDLAKAYKYDNKPAKAIEVLQKMLKLPNRTADDANYKEEGKKLLEELL
jgi:tetratricopeptide (TPR) repeat protein